MVGTREQIFSIAGRMHVLLRREMNRIIDVEWACENAAYAQEIIRISEQSTMPELHDLAVRLREIYPAVNPGKVIAPTLVVAPPPEPKAERYVGSLR
ncbi:MAG: hypothetical protein HY849_08130 [Nitrosomonadales bacterium]|nr:hypothetical protein [Nitrosomonadales bacterium]